MTDTQKAELIQMLTEIIMDESRHAEAEIHNGIRDGAPVCGYQTIEPTGQHRIVIRWADPA